jgi:hypothetical protein
MALTLATGAAPAQVPRNKPAPASTYVPASNPISPYVERGERHRQSANPVSSNPPEPHNRRPAAQNASSAEGHTRLICLAGC